MRRRLIALAVTAVVLAWGGFAPAQPPLGKLFDPKLVAQVGAMLSGVEKTPSPEQWRALDEDGVDLLMVIAANTKEWPARRARAITALGFFPTPEVRRTLVDLLGSSEKPTLVIKSRVLDALARAFGPQALPQIEPYLSDADFFMREAAVRAAGKVGTPEALRLLQARRQAEAEPVLRETIDQTLKTMGK